jgi:hypothetical protein
MTCGVKHSASEKEDEMKSAGVCNGSFTSSAIQKHCPPGYKFAIQVEESLSPQKLAHYIARILWPRVDPRTCVVVPGHYQARWTKKGGNNGPMCVPVQTGWMVFRPA